MSTYRLSEHFTLSEFTHSATAQSRGIANEPPLSATLSLAGLCHNVLEPLRRHAGQPITISSGYRCKKLNSVVGGVANSQHLTGEAADIVPQRCTADGKPLTASQRNAILQDWYDYIKVHLPHDQLIMERSSPSSSNFWLHVSCRLDMSRNRGQAIPLLDKHPV